MRSFSLTAAFCLAMAVCSAAPAQVLVTDQGVQTGVIGPGAPAHTVGLNRHHHTIVMSTGAQTYGLRYGVALDPKKPGTAVPGEGYIGMPEPAGCNWYAGGFFDLAINGKSIGPTLVHSFTGRSSPGRGTVDFVFDAPQAVVRVRFVAKAGGDCLYAQALLEPKVEITNVRVSLRCYPSAFVHDADRHVLTPLRDLAQGERAKLDVAREWWTLYYDRIYDAGYTSAAQRGVGPCAALWLPGQTERVGFTVASYGIDTGLELKPALRDFRFVFFDYAGKKNDAAKADLRGRSAALLRELTAFAFTDPSVATWPLAKKQAELGQALVLLPADKQTAAQYERWGRELAEQLKLLKSGAAGAIMAEADAARTIGQWERGLPELKLKALLNEI
jgi:hypothetical protein